MVVSGATPRVDLAPCAREESCLNSDSSLTVLWLLPPLEGYSSTSNYVFVRVYVHVHSVAVQKQSTRRVSCCVS